MNKTEGDFTKEDHSTDQKSVIKEIEAVPMRKDTEQDSISPKVKKDNSNMQDVLHIKKDCDSQENNTKPIKPLYSSLKNVNRRTVVAEPNIVKLNQVRKTLNYGATWGNSHLSQGHNYNSKDHIDKELINIENIE